PWMGRLLARTAARRSGRVGAAPSPATLAAMRSRIWAEVRNDDGQIAAAMLETGEGYRAAAAATVRAGESLLQTPRIGALTPAQAFGADFARGCPGPNIQELQRGGQKNRRSLSTRQWRSKSTARASASGCAPAESDSRRS